MPHCQIDCIQKWLEEAFYKHGKRVARHPLPFLIIPLVICAISALGLIKIKRNDDTEYLYTPINGPAKVERRIVRNLFQENDTDLFQVSRKSGLDGFVNVIVTDRDNGNIFTRDHLNKIITLDELIHGTNISDGGNYTDLCSKWKGNCHENLIFVILNQLGDMTVEGAVHFPIHNDIYFLGYQLGGVEVDNNGYVTSAKAILLTYNVRYELYEDISRSKEWMLEVKDFLLGYKDNLIKVYVQTSRSIDDELLTAMNGIIPRFAVTYVLLFIFCMCSCSMSDVVRNKTWVVVSGLLAAAMAFLTSMGVLNGFGIPLISTVGSTPFLIAGVSIDNMFVILSAWRHTSYILPVEERMGQTFKTAAISITVTSLTDALALATGAITVFRAVTIFCAYTVLAVVCSYLYAITFVASCFALSGKSEAENRHDLFCFKVLPPEKAVEKSKAYRIFCAGGYDIQNGEDYDKEENTNHFDLPVPHKLRLPIMTHYINDHIAPFLMKTPVKIIVIVLYAIYIGFAVKGCLTLEEGGLKVQNLVPDDSHLVPYFNLEEEYFKSVYGPRVMVVILDRVDYSDSLEREYLFEFLQAFSNNSVFYNHDLFTESWLSAYMHYINQSHQDVSTLTSFIHILRTGFLSNPLFSRFQLDIIFSDDYTTIEKSRFIVQAKGVRNTNDERKLMTESRNIAKNSRFRSIVYNPGFIYYDQYTVIFTNTFQCLGVATACMLLVSLVLLPNLVSVLWVTLSVISICTGVLGYMILWGVSLNTVSMINLIMCIGFSVDFSAHIAYHFAVSEKVRSHHKAQEALGQIGSPILQAAVSTILGVIVLSTSNCYVFRTFFKIMFLVMIFGLLHAMIFLPVMLSLIDFYETSVDMVKSSMRMIIPEIGSTSSQTSSVRVASSANCCKCLR